MLTSNQACDGCPNDPALAGLFGAIIAGSDVRRRWVPVMVHERFLADVGWPHVGLASSSVPRLPLLRSLVLLLIDNYDSFTFNLVQRLGEIDPTLPIEVVRNDQIDVAGAEALRPTHLIISPGPCTPKESGICPALIASFRGRIPILGVCLGHQTIGDVHGMTVRRNHRPVHGKTSPIHHDGLGIFAGLSNPFVATRYHSLIVVRDTVPSEFEVSAWTEEDEVMGLRWRGESGQAGGSPHRLASIGAPMDGVQFHPESFLTVEGPALLRNFLNAKGVQGGPTPAAREAPVGTLKDFPCARTT